MKIKCLDSIKGSTPIVVSLLLTMQCNFECDHCMYECGPGRDPAYMSDEVVMRAIGVCETLNDLGIRASINLVGGEPTLNLTKFEHILGMVTRRDFSVEMTTNGWWLKNPKSTRRFFDIVKPYVEPDGTAEMFSVRISGDTFHDDYRPSWLQGDKLAQYLENLFEYDEEGVWKGEASYWCNFKDKYTNDPDCDGCDNCDVEYDDEYYKRPPSPESGYPWIYADVGHLTWRNVIPVGRAAGAGTDHGCSRFSNANSLSFMPNGDLLDICCKGSKFPVGTVLDHPIVLLELAHRFATSQKPMCEYCHEASEDWIESSDGLKEKIAHAVDLIEENDLWEMLIGE